MMLSTLMHTTATQLRNAGCPLRVTSIQRYLGHKKLNTTLIYARAHDQTVADDYFATMQRIERRLDVMPPGTEPDDEALPERVQLLAWVELLTQPELAQDERLATALQLKQVLAGAASP